MLGCNLVSAQRGGISVTIFGMPQKTFMMGKSGEENASVIAQSFAPEESREIIRKPSYNFAFGFLLKHAISKRITIGYGLQQSPVEQKYHTYVKARKEDVHFGILLKYIKIPLIVQYNYMVKEKYLLFLSVDPNINLLMAENGGIPVYGFNPLAPIFELIDPGGAYRDVVLGTTLSTGGEFELEDKIAVFVRAYFDASISKVEKSSFEELFYENRIFDDPNVTLRSQHNYSAGLSIGLTFRIR